ncbi:MAG: hypothetical protein JF607_05030 [Burkholderiales bacterium]|nr:hypothetical protein [Burkholderiales bacterium]
MTETDMGNVPAWWAVEVEEFAKAHECLKRELGENGFNDFLSQRRREALELWYGLGR